MPNLSAYLRPYSLTNPARMVIRRGATLLVDAIGDHLHGRVLDIGCGAKAKRFLLGPQVTEYIGLDHEGSLHGVGHADVIGTAYSIPQPDATFDGILCTAVLEHLEEPKAALAEALRVLKPGGHAVYTVPLYWHLHEEPRDFYRYTQHGLQYLFDAAGFEVVKLCPAAGFWVTFGSELSYYLQTVARGPFRGIAKIITVLDNLVFPLLDRIDRRLNPLSAKFTWMYLIVARRPVMDRKT